MRIRQLLANKTSEAVFSLYGNNFPSEKVQIQKTRPEFEGDLTIVVFPFLQLSKKSPEQTANEIGNWLKENVAEVSSFNVIKGFLNLVVTENFWIESLKQEYQPSTINHQPSTILLEYSSPNTNKPLHLGHIRNCLLGFSVAKILEANGNKVVKTQIINDRGIHICKSMLAWEEWGRGETPENSGLKGDKLVGKYYVEFDKQLKIQKENLKIEDEKKLPLMHQAQEMLLKWEAKDEEIITLWKMMNSWVYAGFDETYKKLGVSFDKNYYESETYLEGKKIVENGLGKGIFYKKEEGAVCCDLTKEGMEEKVLLRSDGTSVYITQDIGTAILRLQDFPQANKLIYTVGNEQDYHFKVLFAILKKLSEANIIPVENASFYHLSYGMVDLPSGKMKSREGTVVDADDLIDEMIETAKKTTEELGKLTDIPEEKREELYKIIGLGALKYFILKVDPKKRMLFNPQESIDFNGNTGPFIQYTYARIQSLLRKANSEFKIQNLKLKIFKEEKSVLKLIYEFPDVVKEAGETYNPAVIANYIYELVKEYNHFYQSIPVLSETNNDLKTFRLMLSQKTAEIIKSSMELLGIDVPGRM